jgi:hypothetical protein
LLEASGELEVVFVDRSLQLVLGEYAKRAGLLSRGQRQRWLSYPAHEASAQSIVQHVDGHLDHMHVRFSCAGEQGCASR